MPTIWAGHCAQAEESAVQGALPGRVQEATDVSQGNGSMQFFCDN